MHMSEKRYGMIGKGCPIKKEVKHDVCVEKYLHSCFASRWA